MNCIFYNPDFNPKTIFGLWIELKNILQNPALLDYQSVSNCQVLIFLKLWVDGDGYVFIDLYFYHNLHLQGTNGTGGGGGNVMCKRIEVFHP